MLTGTFPWSIKKDMSVQQLFQEIEIISKKCIGFPSDIKISPEMKDLISGCLKYE